MLYLLDANVLIRAHEDYYPIDRVPQFWEWLTAEAVGGHVKMPFEIYDEIAISDGTLRDWLVEESVREALILDEEVDRTLFNRVLDQAYAPDLTDTELEEIGRDPFLVAYAMVTEQRVVVTKEVSKPSKMRGKRKLPDVCKTMGVVPKTDFEFYRERDFHTR